MLLLITDFQPLYDIKDTFLDVAIKNVLLIVVEDKY